MSWYCTFIDIVSATSPAVTTRQPVTPWSRNGKHHKSRSIVRGTSLEESMFADKGRSSIGIFINTQTPLTVAMAKRSINTDEAVYCVIGQRYCIIEQRRVSIHHHRLIRWLQEVSAEATLTSLRLHYILALFQQAYISLWWIITTAF